MTRRDRKTKGGVRIDGKFVPITFEEVNSDAYAELNGNAAKLYVLFKKAARTVAYKNGVGNDREAIFNFTYTEAGTRGFSESTFIRAVKELWAKGFIDIVKRGGIRGKGRTSSQYRLSPLWKTFGNDWTDRMKYEADPFANHSEPKTSEISW